MGGTRSQLCVPDPGDVLVRLSHGRITESNTGVLSAHHDRLLTCKTIVHLDLSVTFLSLC